MSPGTGREIELKRLLSDEAALGRLARAAERRGARAGSPVEQVNHFFDTAAGALRAEGSIVRLREEGGAFVLTAKGDSRISGDVHVRAELECEVAAEEAREIQAGRADPLASLERELGAQPFLGELRARTGGAPLEPSGSFRNHRTRVGPLELGTGEVYLELDRTEFPGERVHYEVELEVPEELVEQAGRLLGELLDEAGDPGAPASGKATRYFGFIAEDAAG
jgi:hypothetical protein